MPNANEFRGIPPGWRSANAETGVPVEAIAAYGNALRRRVRDLRKSAHVELDDLVAIAKATEPVLLRDASTDYTFASDDVRREVVRHLMNALTGPGLPLTAEGADAWTKQ